MNSEQNCARREERSRTFLCGVDPPSFPSGLARTSLLLAFPWPSAEGSAGLGTWWRSFPAMGTQAQLLRSRSGRSASPQGSRSVFSSITWTVNAAFQQQRMPDLGRFPSAWTTPQIRSPHLFPCLPVSSTLSHCWLPFCQPPLQLCRPRPQILG